jgi:hypothetical protein
VSAPEGATDSLGSVAVSANRAQCRRSDSANSPDCGKDSVSVSALAAISDPSKSVDAPPDWDSAKFSFHRTEASVNSAAWLGFDGQNGSDRTGN